MRKLSFAIVLCLVALNCNVQAQLYGLTNAGGNNNFGTIFHYNTSTGSHILDHSFNDLDGSGPTGSLTLFNGKFYGFTGRGGTGTYALGVIFEWNPVTNIYTKKIDLDNTTGGSPIGKLVQSGNKLYGTTTGGAANNYGAIFEWDPTTNIYSKKFDFSAGWIHGGYHSLTLYNNKFYGLSEVESGTGNIFEWDPATNVYTIKKIFSYYTDGAGPICTMVLKDDKFYGTTSTGGVNEKGVVFEWDPATNVYIKKIDFDGINGGGPYGSLIFYADKFYGMTNVGGANNAGVIFEWDPATNNYTKKFDFDGANGANPTGSLTLSGDKFYGTTSNGGTNNKGVIFEWNPNTNTYLKTIDFTNANGGFPYYNDLVEFSPGTLPVKLFSFQALLLNNSNVHLQWQIATTEDGCKYDLQRSSDRLNFISINQQIGHPLVTKFTYTDNALSKGTYYYRLQMIDKDGKTTYSPIIKIEFASKSQLQVFPNPAKNIIRLSGLENKGIVKIISADGKVVKQLSVTANSMLVDLRELPNGIYLVQYNNGELTEQMKLMKE